MISRLAHIGIAVKELDEATKTFSLLLDKEPEAVEEVTDQKVKTAIFDVEGGRIELLVGTAPDSPITKFL